MKSCCRWVGSCLPVVLTVLAVAFPVTVAHAVTAQFELRLPPSTSDAVLDMEDPADQLLDLELWVALSDGPLSGGILAYSVYLQPSIDGVVSFNTSSYVNALPFESPLVQGTDNSPLNGEFSRALFTTSPVLVALGSTKLAAFSVTALSPGEVSYSFASDPPMREWALNFDDGTSAQVTSAPEALTITVIPEPAMAGLVILSMFWVTRHSRRSAL